MPDLIRALPASLVLLITLAYLVSIHHPSGPLPPAGVAIVVFFYAPALELGLVCLGPSGWIQRALGKTNGFAAVWIPIGVVAAFVGTFSNNFYDRYLGALLSNLGLAVTLTLVSGTSRLELREIVRIALVSLVVLYFVTSVCLAALIEHQRDELGDGTCLFAFDQHDWGAAQISGFDLLTLFQRFIAHRGRDHYTEAYRLEALAEGRLYHWSIRELGFVETNDPSLSNVGRGQTCSAEHS